MWLWWLDAKITGPSTSRRCSRPSTWIHAKTRASGRIHVGRLTRRTARAGHVRFQDGNATGSAGIDACAGARSTSGRSAPTFARLGERALVDAVRRTRPRARPSAPRARASSSRARRASSRATRRRPLYLASSAASWSRPAGTARRSPPPATHSRIAARFSFRVPSVRGSSGSGHTSARRIFWCRRAARSPRARSASTDAPGSSTSTACTRSPPPGPGAPTTAESRTPGTWFSTRSTSSGNTFSPSGVTIISFLRPRM